MHVSFCLAESLELGELLDSYRGRWLLAYVAVALGLIVLNVAAQIRLRKPVTECVDPEPPLDLYEIAYLTGGVYLVINTAVTRLVQQGVLIPHLLERSLSITGTMPREPWPVEQAVWEAVQKDGAIGHVRLAAQDVAVLSGRRVQTYQAIGPGVLAGITVVGGFGLVVAMWLWFAALQEHPAMVGRQSAGPAQHNDGLVMGFMLSVTVTIIGLAALAGTLGAVSGRRGRQLLATLQQEHKRLADSDVAVAVALHGLGRGLDSLEMVLNPPPAPSDSGGG